jgi:hypothetical protein
MTDGTNHPTAVDPGPPDASALPPEVDAPLRRWWAAEIRRAERDMLARPIRGAVRRQPARARTLPGVAGLAAVIAAVALAGLLVRPAIGPSASPSGEPSASASGAPPSAETSLVFGADGIPTMIGGERVLRVPEVDIGVVHQAGPFLVGGWAEGFITPSCPPPLPGSSTGRCPIGFGIADKPPAPGGPATASLLLATGQAPMDHGGIVARVGIDPGAMNCTSVGHCPVNPFNLESVVWRWTPPTPSFANRWPDGIPSIVGTEGVVRPADAARNARLAQDDESFLVGGWLSDPFRGKTFFCPISVSFLTPLCGGLRLAEAPGGPPADLHLAFPGVDKPPLADGPVILQVHARDPLAARCPAGFRTACERALVVEAVVWTGDAWTATQPLDILTVLSRLNRSRLGQGDAGLVDPLDPQPAACIPALPHDTYVEAPGEAVGLIAVFPTSADRELFDAGTSPGSIAGTRPDDTPCRSPVLATSRWASVDNVAVEVRQADAATMALIQRALGSPAPTPTP